MSWANNLLASLIKTSLFH